MFNIQMYKTVWDAMQQGDISVTTHVNRPDNKNPHMFCSGTRSALCADYYDPNNITFVRVSGFYKHDSVVLVKSLTNDEIYVYGRYGRLAILPDSADFDYGRALAEINAEQYAIYRERGFYLDTGWGAIHRQYGL